MLPSNQWGKNYQNVAQSTSQKNDTFVRHLSPLHATHVQILTKKAFARNENQNRPLNR